MKVKQWKCIPCREQSRLRNLSTLAMVAAREEEPKMATAGKYKLLRGVKHRIEGGKVRVYHPGDIIELDEREAAVLALSVEPVRQATMRAGPPISEPPTEGNVLDAPAAVVTKRIAGVDDDSTLDRLADTEASGKGRKSVFRAIEDRRAELQEDGS